MPIFMPVTILDSVGLSRYEAKAGTINLHKVVEATECEVSNRGVCTKLRMEGGESVLCLGGVLDVLGADNVFEATNRAALKEANRLLGLAQQEEKR